MSVMEGIELSADEPATSFPQFPKLPNELQLKIWGIYVVGEERIVEVRWSMRLNFFYCATPTPPALRTCVLSRMKALSIYKVLTMKSPSKGVNRGDSNLGFRLGRLIFSVNLRKGYLLPKTRGANEVAPGYRHSSPVHLVPFDPRVHTRPALYVAFRTYINYHTDTISISGLEGPSLAGSSREVRRYNEFFHLIAGNKDIQSLCIDPRRVGYVGGIARPIASLPSLTKLILVHDCINDNIYADDNPRFRARKFRHVDDSPTDGEGLSQDQIEFRMFRSEAYRATMISDEFTRTIFDRLNDSSTMQLVETAGTYKKQLEHYQKNELPNLEVDAKVLVRTWDQLVEQ